MSRWPLEFREPWFLLLALAALPVLWSARRRGGTLLFSSVALLPRHTGSLRSRLAFLPELALALATLGLAVAMAGPRVGDRRHRVEREGIAIMMVVDVSGSMRALDLGLEERRTRLDVVKTVFEEFVLGKGDLPGRPSDTIGLVSFARYADTRCPLTLDHGNLALIARSLQLVESRDEDGTAIGDGLGLAIERLRESSARSRVVILLTDGVSNAGEETPLGAAELARALGVKVYTIGAGTSGVAPIAVQDPFTGREVLQAVPVEIDEATLRQIAERTGGKYFRATDGAALRQVYAAIDRLERSRHSEERFTEYHEYYGVVLAVSLLLAALGWLGRATVFRRLP